MRHGLVAVLILLVGCSSGDKQAKSTAAAAPVTAAKNTNPIAKYIELVGFRINEKNPGRLQIQFAAVNHSEADIGDLKMNVSLRTTASKPGDAAVISFDTKIPSLGPSELKALTVDVPTKLRVYELPDWQFLRAEFQIIEPQ